MTLSPIQRQSLLWGAVAAVLAAILVALGPVLSPLAAAAILGYTLAPPVRRLVGWGLPRPLAVILVMLAAIAVLLALALVLAPVVNVQAGLIRQKLPDLLAGLEARLLPWLHDSAGIDVTLDLNSIGHWIAAQMSADGNDWAGVLLGYAQSGWRAAVGVLGLVFLVPVIMFYLLADWDGLLDRFLELVPPRWRAQVRSVGAEIDGILVQYLRGQLLVMICLAGYYAAALALGGIALWLPIGVLTGLLVAVPYLGFATGLVFALISAMLQLGPGHGLAVVALVYGFGQVLESFVLTPRLVGERIGLHPLAVILALLVFGALFGFVGVLLALPAAALVAVGLARLRSTWLESAVYGNE